MMKHIKLILASLAILLLAAGRHNPEPHDRHELPDKPDPVVQAIGSIKENCHDNYKISFYLTKESRAVGENNELAWGLFQRGDLECDYRGACLYMVEVNEKGDVRFVCERRRPQEDE